MSDSHSPNPAVSILVGIAAFVVILAGIKTASDLLVPFLLSLFIAMVCNPLIKKATYYRIPKGLAVTLVILIFVTVALSVAGLVGRSANELTQNLPVYREQLSDQIEIGRNQRRYRSLQKCVEGCRRATNLRCLCSDCRQGR